MNEPSHASRAEILALLHGARPSHIPAFSGLISVTQAGLEEREVKFSEIHNDSAKLASAAASSYELLGFESAVLPADLTVEAEALGAGVDFRTDMAEPMWPIVTHPLAGSPSELRVPSGDVTQRGRIPLVSDALRQLKARVGEKIVVGAVIPGPFTLAMQVIQFDVLLMDVARNPAAVGRALDALTDVLIAMAQSYHTAGADFITVHEMGGSPGVIGPPAFGSLLLPRLQRLIAAVPAPRVLSVCGNTNQAMPLLVQAGADAISVDQLNDIARSREIIGRDAFLFGNIDPVGVLAHSDERGVRRAVENAIEEGVDAIWPGCDLYLTAPPGNLVAMVRAAHSAHRK